MTRIFLLFSPLLLALSWYPSQGFIPHHTFHTTTSTLWFTPTTRTPTNFKTQLNFFQNIIESLTGSTKSPSSNSAGEVVVAKRESLKAALLEACRNPATKNKKQQRATVEALMEELQQVNPTTSTASSLLLQRRWALEWTTEKEINFFLDVGLSNQITQTISTTTIGNRIEFVRAGGFYVDGILSIPDPKGCGTDFEFITATCNLGERWGQYTFPPVGSGWFETLYLDDTLRVDINSRSDILICTPLPN